jgi:hypothetical protein
MEWFRAKFGDEAYHDLHRKYLVPHKFKNFELEEEISKINALSDGLLFQNT